MRRPAKSSSAFFHPLDEVLGTVGAVRVLRTLATTQTAFAPAELAQRTGLHRSGVISILHRLTITGVVAAMGSGPRPQFRLDSTHPIATGLIRLFDDERRRADQVFSALRETMGQAQPVPAAVWLVGSAARGTDRPSSDVDIVVVQDGPRDTGQSDTIADAVAKAMPLGVAAMIIQLSRADVARLRATDDPRWKDWARDAVVLLGAGPNQLRTDGTD